MDKGKRFTFNAQAFPRYRYFQIRLKGLVPRWQRILEAGGLPDCISEGVSRLKDISNRADRLTEQLHVYLFAEEQFLRTNDLQFPVESNSFVFGEVGVHSITWSSCIEVLSVLDFQPSVIVIAKAVFDTKVFELLSGLDDVLLGKIILYNTETKKNVLYTDLARAGFSLSDVDLGGKKALRHTALSAQIQHLLEEKVVGILELITDYIHPFVPRPEQEQSEDIQGVVHTALYDALSDQYVVSDIEPSNQDVQRIATSDDLMTIARDAIGNSWKSIGRYINVKEETLNRIEMENAQDKTMQHYLMLKAWSEQSGSEATLQKLVPVLKKITADAVNWDAIYNIDADRNGIFQKNFSEFLNKKSRCVTCSNFSKKYGIPEHIVNEFLNDGFYGFDKRFSSYMKKTQLPEYPPSKYETLVELCRGYVFMFIIELKDLFVEFEDYIKAKLKVLYVMLKLQFELFGMLRLADVEMQVPVPPLNVLSKELQQALIDFCGVEACGTFYGELWLHLKQQPSRNFLAEIREMLEGYKYGGGFKWETIPQRVEQARGLVIEPGQTLRACRPNGPNPHIYGSLGCFVKVSPKDTNIAQNIASAKPGTKVSEAGLVQTSSVHAITCAHCVKDCHIVEVQKGDDFVHFGHKRLELYFRDLLDVATIGIKDVNTCVSDLKRFDERCTNTWTCFPSNPCGRQVQKAGSTTKFTKGIVMSSDYVSNIMQGHQLQRLRHNICIESLPDIPEGLNILNANAPLQSAGGQFSNEGDSGSVVCADNPEDNSVFIVSLLMGAVVDQGEGHVSGAAVNTGHIFSYSSEFKSTLEELKVRYDVNIEPAVLTGPPPPQQDSN